jgi:hypothetical protein
MFYPFQEHMFTPHSGFVISEVHMLNLSRGALPMATASLVTALLAGPVAAYAADTSTSLSAAEMSTALKAVSTASAQAAAHGWKAAIKVTSGSLSGSESFIVDKDAGVTFERFAFSDQVVAQYVVAGKGTYAALADPQSRAAVKMMHRSSVRYVFIADKSATPEPDLGVDGMSPATLLSDDINHAGTKTVHDDGSVDYRLSEDAMTATVHVTAAGVLASFDVNGDGTHELLTYAYGPQHVKLPPASATISAATLAHGLAYLDMSASVRQITGQTATDALRSAHGHQITVSSLRKIAQRDVNADNAAVGVKMIKTQSVRGGVRVSAKNPWTHRTSSYTLTASGRKVIIAQK